ncbi:hypothetical protein EGY05_18955 [Chryseobacterium arthrosphaerae]|uniref:hypothetical protein n=1 Tax=Chryseobacterium arthrosphaerae TaxID=651561 RepID=UPI000F6CC29F|nr:hypothetical protein [Chryseobacterium arthrosphaerae]AYZ13886.1 hypothetical protein EGY05_18955 [Chryseobacterium arthrosphaerae]MDG4654763.1 hypothetical protein [Chryseobacterium arthrosphaerae]
MDNKKFYFNKKYYFYDRHQNIIIAEDDLVGKKMDDLEGFFTDYKVQKLHTKERVFILRKSFLGIVTLKLHLYLSEDTVYDYSIQP